jgi:MFS family permease
MASEMGDRARLDYASSMTRREAMRTGRFYALVLAFGLFQISITVMLLQTVPFMTDAGYPRLLAASMISLTSIPALISKPFWGMLIDRYSARPLAAIGAGITGFSLIIIVLAVQVQNNVLVYSAFFLMGLGWGGLIPLQEVIWASYFGRRYLGSVRATALPFTFAMTALGPVLAAAHYDHFGNYDNAFLMMAVCNLLAAFMLLFISDARPEPRF